MTRIMQDAGRVLDALDEGIISGIIMYLEYHNPNISKNVIKEVLTEVLLPQWSEDKLNYWLGWFGLSGEE